MKLAVRCVALAALSFAACGDDPVVQTEGTRARPSAGAAGGAGMDPGSGGTSTFVPVVGGAAGSAGRAGADGTSSGGSSVAGPAGSTGAGAGGTAGSGGAAGKAGNGGAAPPVCVPAECAAPSECTAANLCCRPQATGAFGDALVGARVSYTLKEADALDIDIDFDTLPAGEPGKSVGMFLYFQATIGGSSALWGVQTDLLDGAVWVGRGALFSRLDSSDASNAKVASGGFMTTDAAAKVVGVRRSFPWGLGVFRLRLARDQTGGSSAGHFFTLSMGSVGDPLTSMGALRFPTPSDSTPPRISAGVGAGILLYRQAQKYEEVPLWKLGLKLSADGVAPASATYDDGANSFLNADVSLGPEGLAGRSLVLALGGNTRRCHSPGALFLADRPGDPVPAGGAALVGSAGPQLDGLFWRV